MTRFPDHVAGTPNVFTREQLIDLAGLRADCEQQAMTALSPVYNSYNEITCMAMTEPKGGPRNWRRNHPMAGLAEFRYIRGRWVGGGGNLAEPCRWRPGYWVITPICCATRSRPVWGLKADPGGITFETGEGTFRTVASDLFEQE